MESGPEREVCMGCGGTFPASDLFGLPGDHRCPQCAEALRGRTNPAVIRRSASSIGMTSGGPDGKATAGVLAVMIAVWLMGVIPSPLGELIAKSTLVWGYRVPEEEPSAPNPTPPPGVERERPSAPDPGLEAARRAWEEQRFVVITRPQPWLFLLWVFIHGGIIHLLMNGMWLYQSGRWIEWGWGRFTYLFVLVASATASTAAGWLVNGAPTIGISGGIFAIIGWLVAQRRRHPVAAAIVTPAFWNSLLAGMVILVVLTELGGMRISHVGHAAGFLWGLGAGYVASSRRPGIGWGVIALATLAILILPSYVEPLGWDLTLFKRGA
jgi:membrane associated rhomboid family serine protease